MAGLSAGIYAQMNDYESEIFEKHYLPGGLCTAWNRKNFTFEGCLHYMVGFSPIYNFTSMWKDLGVKSIPIFLDEITRYYDKQGRVLIVYTDINKFENHLKDLSPIDKDTIEEFANAIRLFTKFNPPKDKPMELVSVFDLLHLKSKFISFSRAYFKYKSISVAEFASKFKDDLIRSSLCKINGFEDFPVVWLMMILSRLTIKDAAYPERGSLALAQDIEKRYFELGGKIHYNTEIVEILTKNNRAIGIKTLQGETYYSDIIISASDAYRTIHKLLQSKYNYQIPIHEFKEGNIYPSYVQVSLGVDCLLNHYPYSITKKVNIGVEKISLNELTIRNFSFDKFQSPAGKTSIVIQAYSSYNQWSKFMFDKKRYNEIKSKIGESIIEEIEKNFPEIKGKIEVIDIASPLTYERYTNTSLGSCQGWRVNKKNFGKLMNYSLKDLQGMYLIGQWIVPGGAVHRSAQTGLYIIKKICRNDRKKFVS